MTQVRMKSFSHMMLWNHTYADCLYALFTTFCPLLNDAKSKQHLPREPHSFDFLLKCLFKCIFFHVLPSSIFICAFVKYKKKYTQQGSLEMKGSRCHKGFSSDHTTWDTWCWGVWGLPSDSQGVHPICVLLQLLDCPPVLSSWLSPCLSQSDLPIFPILF